MMMMMSTENPVDQRFLEWCCCSIATGLVIASSVTEGVTRPAKHIEYSPPKFNSCRIRNQPLKFRPLRIQSHQFNRGSISHLSKTSSSLDICAAAFNSTYVELETEPLTRRHRTPTRTLAPFKGKFKSPSVDDGGNRLPPRGGRGRKFYDGSDGDGMPPGGGGHWWGELFFGLVQAFVAVLSDRKQEKRTEEEEEEWRRVD